MSEFRQEWPQTTDMQDHLSYMQHGLRVIDEQLVLPSDNRWAIGYGALVMGGQQSSVFGEGMTSTGKSEWGNIVIGEHNRVDIDPTDTVGTLEGVESIVTHKTTKPKIHIADDQDVRLFLDEISHLESTAPMHKYWTGNEVTLPNGQVLDMRNASIYSTANFRGGRSKNLDDAIRSRLGINLLAGDGGSEHAKAVSEFVQPELGEEYRDGLLPPAKIRESIRQVMELSAPKSSDSAVFMIDVIENANASGLLQPIDMSNKRRLNSWEQAVRARRLVDHEVHTSGPITTQDLARVASLGLGSSASLSNVGSELLADSLGKIDTLSQLEKAIFARRVIAGIAMKTLIESMDIKLGIDKEQDIMDFIGQRSYAALLETHTEAADVAIVDTLLGAHKTNQGSTDVQQKSDKRFGIFNRR